MEQQTILKTLAWLRRKFRDEEHEVTLYNLFECAFIEHVRVFDEKARVQLGCDIQTFEAHGTIPAYLARFMRRLYARYFVEQQPADRKETSCVSAK
ncbi:MAG TPA: hypothetical protein VF803_02890 [Candidatus Paceibacterota bacterium]